MIFFERSEIETQIKVIRSFGTQIVSSLHIIRSIPEQFTAFGQTNGFFIRSLHYNFRMKRIRDSSAKAFIIHSFVHIFLCELIVYFYRIFQTHILKIIFSKNRCFQFAFEKRSIVRKSDNLLGQKSRFGQILFGCGQKRINHIARKPVVQIVGIQSVTFHKFVRSICTSGNGSLHIIGQRSLSGLAPTHIPRKIIRSTIVPKPVSQPVVNMRNSIDHPTLSFGKRHKTVYIQTFHNVAFVVAHVQHFRALPCTTVSINHFHCSTMLHIFVHIGVKCPDQKTIGPFYIGKAHISIQSVGLITIVKASCFYIL